MSAGENKAEACRLLKKPSAKAKRGWPMRCSIQSSSYDPNSEVGEVRGAETIKEKINYFRQAVPDLTYTVEDQVYLKATRS